jgi:glycosyl transferase family 25
VNNLPTAAGRALLGTFEATRIINLKAREDRRREITSEFRRLGINLDSEKVRFHEAARFAEAAPFPSLGAKGCYYSHLAVLEEARANNFENILVLEDDCDFIGDIESKFLRATEELRGKEWDFFFGGHEDVACDENSHAIQQIKSGTWVRGTHFVAFSKKAIDAIVPYLQKEIQHLAADPVGGARGIDAAYTHFGREFPEFRYFIAWPKLAYQRPSRTDVQEPSAFDRMPLINSMIVPARKLKRLLRRRST